MDYKKIIKSQRVRFKILGLFDFLPDKRMLQLQYRIKTGRKLKLNSPERYTEKLQWYKLFYRDPLMTECSDKFLVRKYVEQKGLGDILNPLYGVYENEESINFDELPNSFAIKHTNGSGANLFIQDKTKMNKEEVTKTIREWMNKRKANYGREWCYYNVQSRIIIEKLLERDENNDIPDYKFFCFNGKVKYLYTMVDYVDNHKNGRCSFFTRDFDKLPYRRSEYKAINREIEKPDRFDKMIEIAEILSKDFPHVRVDLYNLKGQIIFGELTFYNASGYTIFYPDEFDFILGNEFKLPKQK
ncbi:ATP-grasp fold amidoligase family protein [Cytobacillus firmus]|uniref:ATP-grasp fold amidoligase family protein n=1 Tax=Cytobacillus firmus TaxID=1399 RepID=UPI001C8D7720|nr:ATP-grasp fold amidoligase family protein [Cytobacillus firmus]MBX9974447.1 carbonic anhydrase [Cytobacillus firmus]